MYFRNIKKKKMSWCYWTLLSFEIPDIGIMCTGVYCEHKIIASYKWAVMSFLQAPTSILAVHRRSWLGLSRWRTAFLSTYWSLKCHLISCWPKQSTWCQRYNGNNLYCPLHGEIQVYQQYSQASWSMQIKSNILYSKWKFAEEETTL